ncbi:uracil-xanthine permease family protein [[Clostridium] polysaccharolyticum]|uniref:Uracil permease n=1 Tax=[Clostridium] polysaccharolyticum TaxID=29364 RepID=A0A1H9Z6V7_9FIRM|nr:uracil-xanthine permease family protein [[Clostridium] polysaccharolyticum]SES77268.1 uracil permease [[Clostridium] polysaccharolyticum]
MKHTKKRDTSNEIYDVLQLGWPKALVLGLQHAFAMFGATVMVPMITGLSVTTTLFMAGLGTLLFHFLTKRKVPAFLGSSFAFIGGYTAVAPKLEGGLPNNEMLPYACGGVLAAGFVYVLLSAFIKLFGVKKIMRIFPPVVTGPIIISIGLILAPNAINNCSQNWVLAFIALATVIICNIFGKGMIKIIPIILGIVVSYIAACFMKLGGLDVISFSSIHSAKLLAIPYPDYGLAKFDFSAIVTIVPIALATMMEHIGDISAISATTGENYISSPGLHKTLLGDGLATSLSALFGGPANTTYGENTGVLALTKVYDPLVMRIAACFAIFLSFFPVVGAFIGSIPLSIIGGISFILYGMISAIGIRNLIENHVDFTNTRNLVISAVILVSALGFNTIGGITFTAFDTKISLSGLAIASIAGILLNIILPGNDYEFGIPSENK